MLSSLCIINLLSLVNLGSLTFTNSGFVGFFNLGGGVLGRSKGYKNTNI
jgi:hypothetical protein